jgi:hypothetical protein
MEDSVAHVDTATIQERDSYVSDPQQSSPLQAAKKKKILSEKQLESLRLGREKRMKMMEEKKRPEIMTQQEYSRYEVVSDQDEPDDEEEYPGDRIQEDSDSETEVVRLRRPLSESEKKLRRMIDRRLKKAMKKSMTKKEKALTKRDTADSAYAADPYFDPYYYAPPLPAPTPAYIPEPSQPSLNFF